MGFLFLHFVFILDLTAGVDGMDISIDFLAKLRVRCFGKIRILIFDPRSLGSWCIKGTDKSLAKVDSSVPLIHHDQVILDQKSGFKFYQKKETLRSWSCLQTVFTDLWSLNGRTILIGTSHSPGICCWGHSLSITFITTSSTCTNNILALSPWQLSYSEIFTLIIIVYMWTC